MVAYRKRKKAYSTEGVNEWVREEMLSGVALVENTTHQK